MYKVTYHTLNDTYIKTFSDLHQAKKFCRLIKKLYPEQNPVVQ